MFGFRRVKVLSKFVFFFKLGSVNLSNLHCRSVDICSSTSKEEALWARRSRGRDGGCRAGPSVTMSRSGLLHILPLPHKVTNNKITWFTSQLTTVSPSIVNNVRKKGRRLVVELNCMLQIIPEILPICWSGDLDQDLPLQTLSNPKKHNKSLYSISWPVAKTRCISMNEFAGISSLLPRWRYRGSFLHQKNSKPNLLMLHGCSGVGGIFAVVLYFFFND